LIARLPEVRRGEKLRIRIPYPRVSSRKVSTGLLVEIFEKPGLEKHAQKDEAFGVRFSSPGGRGSIIPEKPKISMPHPTRG